MLLLIYRFLRKDYLEYYPKLWMVPSTLAPSVMFLVAYWHMAKAFAPKFEILGSNGNDYFTFIVIGEAVLALPLTFLTNATQDFRLNFANGTLESLMTSRTAYEKTLVISSFSSAILTLFQTLIILTVAATVFDLDIKFSTIPIAILFQLASYPLFVSLGLFGASLFIYFGRGAGIIGSLSGFVSVFAGIYFPTTVFPDSLHRYLNQLSPFNSLLTHTRKVLSDGWQDDSLQILLIFTTIGLILFPMSYSLLKISLNRMRKRGASLFYFA